MLYLNDDMAVAPGRDAALERSIGRVERNGMFLGVGDGLIYHFSKTSTDRIRKNDGRRQFLMKWGTTQSGFDRYYLRRGRPAPADPVFPEPQASWGLRRQVLKSVLKRRFGRAPRAPRR